MKKRKPIPELGKQYHFWDDGKCGPGRHYICQVSKIFLPDQAKTYMVRTPNLDVPWDTTEPVWELRTLWDVWKEQVKLCSWIYSRTSDRFVEALCPVYDDNPIWFVRTRRGSWFSLDIQSSWQGGILDVDSEIWNRVTGDPDIRPELLQAYQDAKYEKTQS